VPLCTLTKTLEANILDPKRILYPRDVYALLVVDRGVFLCHLPKPSQVESDSYIQSESDNLMGSYNQIESCNLIRYFPF